MIKKSERLLAIFTLFLLCFGGQFGRSVLATWTTETVVEGHWFESLLPDGFQYGPDYSTHMAYGGGHLYYQVKDSNGTTIETVDPGIGTGAYASLALTSTGDPMIVYRDETLSLFKFAWKTGGVWEIITLDNGDSTGRENAIECDSQGNPHIVYTNADAADLNYAYRASDGHWTFEVVDAVRKGAYCSLALHNDSPRVCYFDENNLNLMVAYRNGVTWQRFPLSTADNDGLFCAMDVNSFDAAYIVFYNVSDQQVNFVRFDGTSFGEIHVVDNATVYSQMDMILDNEGWVRAFYNDNSANQCRAALGLFDSWLVTTVDTGDSIGRSVALAQSAGSTTYLRYMDISSGVIHGSYGTFSGGWTKFDLDQRIIYGSYPHMILDKSNYPLTYFQEFPGRQTHSISYDGTSFEFNENPVTENFGIYYEVAQFSDGHQIAVSTDFGVTLRGHYFDGATWQNADIFTLSGRLRDVNVAISADDSITIICQNADIGKFTVLESAAWTGPYSVTEFCSSYGGCDVKIDSQGKPHMVYFNEDVDELRHSWKDESNTWQTEFVSFGDYDSLQIELTTTDELYVCGHYHMGFYLEVIHGTSGSYTVERFPDSVSIEDGFGFALTSDDRPAIAYRFSDYLVFRYAEYNGSDWVYENLFTEDSVGTIQMVHSPVTGITIGFRGARTGDYHMLTRATGMYYDLGLNGTTFGPGDPFILTHQYSNNTVSAVTVDEYLILDVMGAFWFWPSWSESVDFSTYSIPVGTDTTEEIFNFLWPSGTGTFDGIIFWGGILTSGTSDLILYDYVEWGYSE